MNIERGPRKERGFVIIDNALAQNNLLSFGARGLAEYLLSLPPGAKVDIRSLAMDNPEGRDAIAGYMNELESQRYLVRTRVRGERGRFVTTTTMHEEPQSAASLPDSLPKPWSKARKADRQHLTAVPQTEAGEEFSQVGPNPASPDFGQPNFGGPAPGGPDVGEAGVNPSGVKEPGGRTSSSPAREEGTVFSEDAREGGGGDDPQQEQAQAGSATSFVDRLPYRGRIPGPRQRAHLVDRVSWALAAGWTEWALHRQLTEETGTAKSLAAVYRHRLSPENLPAPPLPAQRTDGDQASAARKAKCPECHRPLRNSNKDALCSDCREDASA